MEITYDPETDTLTIRLKEVHISESDELQAHISHMAKKSQSNS